MTIAHSEFERPKWVWKYCKISSEGDPLTDTKQQKVLAQDFKNS